MQPQRGFTLIELLVVLVIIAIAAVSVTLSVRDTQADLLQRDAQRLTAQLEAKRSASRTSGVVWVWRVQGNGYVIEPTTAQKNDAPLQITWYSTGLVAQTNSPDGRVVLGPEPLLSPISIDLSIDSGKSPTRLQITSDGLSGFEVRP